VASAACWSPVASRSGAGQGSPVPLEGPAADCMAGHPYCPMGPFQDLCREMK